MAVPAGRSDRRITKELTVELARPDASRTKETAVTQNISAHGMRVTTEHAWRSGDHLLISSSVLETATLARVVYCQRLQNKRFAVGLELLGPPGKRTKSR